MTSSTTTLTPVTNKTKIAAIYVRVSSRQQKEEETIESQIDTLLNFAKKNNFDIPEELIFRDEGYSGASTDRPGLDKIRDIARECPIEAILIYSPDRLARRYVLQLILEEEFRKFGVRIIYFKGQSQNENPESLMLSHLQGIFAEYERAQILDRTRRGKLYKARQGDVRVLSNAPFGFCKERDLTFYTIKQNEAEIVQNIFSLFTKDRLNMQQISRYLEEKGVSAPKGGLKWSTRTIKGILENPAYTGIAYFGKTETFEGNIDRVVRYKTRGKVIKPLKGKRPRSKEFWEPLSVPRIICDSTFSIAQELLIRNKELASRNTKESSVLQGLLVCGLCGSTYYKKKRGGEKSRTYYSCRSNIVKGNHQKCGNRSVRQEDLDKAVWDNIVELLKNPNLIRSEIERRCSLETKDKPIEMRRIDLEKEIKQIEKSHNKLLDAYQESDCLTLDELRNRSKSLKAKENSLKKEIESLEAFQLRFNDFEYFKETLEKLQDRLDNSFNLPAKDKQKIARTLIEDIVILPEEILVKHAIPVSTSTNSLLCADGGS